MKFSFSTLKEYLNTSFSFLEICEKLTSLGLEVESIQDQSEELSHFSVAKIIDTKPHENSNKLKICSVETIDSKDLLQIVCGAQNARAGIKVAYAPIGAKIPANDMIIKKAKIAGVESCGMLCSFLELKIEGYDDLGIIEIDDKYKVGDKISDIFGLNDQIIEINVTPNRGDCLGVYGIARDLSAAGAGKLKDLAIETIKPSFDFSINITNQENSQCKSGAFCLIKDIKNQKSPDWLIKKLNNVGINSVSAVVDILNYVSHILNQPMHAYDADKIDGEIIIKLANDNESFISLADKELILDNKTLVVSDKSKPISIAGIIGSKNSSLELETKNVIIESLFFTPETISRSGQKLMLLTDARHRFERGVDEEMCEVALNMAVALISSICGGSVSTTKTIGEKSQKNQIKFNPDFVEKIIGLKISHQEIKKILLDLNMKIKEDGNFILVSPPSYRHDILIAQDLVEEIARIYGYDNISAISLNSSFNGNKSNIYHTIRKHLYSKGMMEVINWSFVDEKLIEIFDEKNQKLILENPISSEMNHMRKSLNIGLLQSCYKNNLRGFFDISMFEIGNVFKDDNSQELMISGIRVGKNKQQDHYADRRNFDIFDVKKDLLDVVEFFNIKAESLQIESSNPLKYYHPYRFANVKLGKNIIGYFGEIHPIAAKNFSIKDRINIFEIFIDRLPPLKLNTNKQLLINDLPVVERDFAFIVDKNLPVGDMIKTIYSSDKQLIKDVNIFDIFSGNNVPSNKKSVAIRVNIQHNEKTLNSDEIEAISQKIISNISDRYQATLRQN